MVGPDFDMHQYPGFLTVALPDFDQFVSITALFPGAATDLLQFLVLHLLQSERVQPLSATTETTMTDDELLRYSRQILLPDFDIEGQERLRQSHALIVGLAGWVQRRRCIWRQRE